MKRTFYLLLLALLPAVYSCNQSTPAPKTEAHDATLPPLCAKLNGTWWTATGTEGQYARNVLSITATDAGGTVLVIEVYNNTGELVGEYPFTDEGSTQLLLTRGGKSYQATSGKVKIEKAEWRGEESVTVSGTFSASVARPGEKVSITEGSFRNVVCPLVQ